VEPADSPAVSVNTAFPGGGGDAERRGGGGGGGGTACCKGERFALTDPARVEARVSLESGSGRLGALLGLRGVLALPPPASELELLRIGRGNEGFLALPPASELCGVELLTQIDARVSLESGSGRLGALLGLRGFLALPPPASELRERMDFGLLCGGGGSEGLALPPASELREVELLSGGGGNEGFLALPPELWEIELGGDGGAAIFRPQWHRGDWSMPMSFRKLATSAIGILVDYV
jgi:hypothetical protein